MHWVLITALSSWVCARILTILDCIFNLVNDIHPYIHVGGTFLDSLSTTVITLACEDPKASCTSASTRCSASTRVPQSVQDILMCIIVLSIVGLVDFVLLPIRHF